MDAYNQTLEHQSISQILDDDIPINSQSYTTFSNFAGAYLTRAQRADSAKPSMLFEHLDTGHHIGVGNYEVLLDILERSKLIQLKKRIEDKAKKIGEKAVSSPLDGSSYASTAASTDSPESVDQLSTNSTKQSRQNLVFNIIQKSLACKHWKNLGRGLGVKEPAIESITADNANKVEEQCYQMLLKWRQTQPADRDTPEVLVKALEGIDCQSVADEIKTCLMQYIMKKPFDE